MLHIRKIKTMYGLRYAVVDKFPYWKTIVGKDKKTHLEKVEEYHAVEYKVGSEYKVAIFELTEDGLERAKEVQSLFRKGQKNKRG